MIHLHFIFAILENVFPPLFCKTFLGERENSASMKRALSLQLKFKSKEPQFRSFSEIEMEMSVILIEFK